MADREPWGAIEKLAFPVEANHPETCALASTAYTDPVPELDAVTGTARHSVPPLQDATEICPMRKLGEAVPVERADALALGALAAVVRVTDLGVLPEALWPAVVEDC